MAKENEKKETIVDEGRRLFLRNSTIAVAGFPLAQIAYAADAPAAPARPRAKSLLVQRKRCTGCNSCAFGCSLYHDSASDGPKKEGVITEEMMKKAQDAYYTLVGWDADGIPAEESMKKYELDFVIKDIKK
ncbi:MAG: hypothetical protein LBB60_05965 [Desulfovibrio sp.]|nr:hypothetical protein [Desulfovibrio sp.]